MRVSIKPKRRRGKPTTPLKTHAKWQVQLARRFFVVVRGEAITSGQFDGREVEVD